jgi:hypothetical protein
MLQRGCATLAASARAGRAHAFVAAASAETSDAQILRTVEQARDASPETEVILLPPLTAEAALDRRWSMLLDQAMQLHARTMIGTRVMRPAGMR